MTCLVPLSRSQREQIEFLRTWLTEGRGKSANFPERYAVGQSEPPSPHLACDGAARRQ